MNAWYIDAIDARAGIAVATHRTPEAGGPSQLADEAAVAFIAPPTFTPEFLSSRVIGMGLARSFAQIGFYVGDGEVPFDSLDDVAEFVRRAYLRGAGGDGPAGGEGPLPPGPREDGGGEGLRPIEPSDSGRASSAGRIGGRRGVDPASSLIYLSKEIAQNTAGKKLGWSGKAPTLELGKSLGNETQIAVRRVVRGALLVLRELHRRKPRGNLSDADLGWLDDCIHFNGIINRLGIQPWFWREFHSEWELGAWFGILSSSSPEDIQRRRPDLIGLLFDHYPFYMSHRDYWLPLNWFDPVERLERLPMPAGLVEKSDQPNLLATLSMATASPGEYFSGKSDIPEQRAEITLFAATVLNLLDDCPIGWQYYYDEPLLTARAIGRGQEWLVANMPRVIFNNEVEKFIDAASTVQA